MAVSLRTISVMRTTDNLITIDCNYIKSERAAAYLIVSKGETAFVDNNTPRAVPLLLDALKNAGHTPDSVKYLIVTHIHLDHSAGTAALLEACPNAVVLAHPRAVRHLVDPTRLVESAKQVYGEELFARLYGTVQAVPEARVRAVNDNEQISLNDRKLVFMHTAGHARHHITIFDETSKTAFTGDTFGVSHPRFMRGTRPFVLCSTAPTEFEPDKAHESVKRIVEIGALRAALTHFGILDNVPAAAPSLLRSIEDMAAILHEAAESPLEGEALVALCEEKIRRAVRREMEESGITATVEDEEWLNGDIRINAAGIAYCATRMRNTKTSS